MKKSLLTICLILACLPAAAHNTRPTDTVSVDATTYDSYGTTELSSAVYTKPWSQIKIDAKTVQKIDGLIAKFRADHRDWVDKSYRIIHLSMADGHITRAMVLTEYGTAISMDLHNNHYCYTSIAGNGNIGGTCAD